MNQRLRYPTLCGLLCVLGAIAIGGCGAQTGNNAASPMPSVNVLKAIGAADAKAWALGHKLSLAALGHVEQAPRAAVNNVMAEARRLAQQMGVELEPLPPRNGNRTQDAAAVLNYLLSKHGQSISRELEGKYGRRQSLLFQVSMKTNLLLLLYNPSQRGESLAIVDFLSEKAKETQLPDQLWSPLVSRVRSGVPYQQVKTDVRQFQDAVLAHLSNVGEAEARSSQPPRPKTGVAELSLNSPNRTIPDPPSSPSPPVAGERYLRQLTPTSVVALPEGREHHFDREFKVQGVLFQSGVYFCPPAPNSTGIAIYELGQAYRRLKGGVAISDHRFRKAWSPVTFRISGDGKVIWTSRPLQPCGDWQAFDVDLSGVKQLALEVQCSGPHTGAHGSWMDPVLVGGGP